MPPILTYLLILLLGWVCGVLVNYLSDVLPHKRRIARPFCLECAKPVPPINYFLLPRRCPSCGTLRHKRVFAVEILYPLAFLWMWNSPPEKLGFWLGALLLTLFGVIAVIDLEYRLILHPVSIVAAVIGLGVGMYLNGIVPTLIGGAVGYGAMFFLYWLGAQLAKLAGRMRGEPVVEDALGYGDVNLSGVLGLMVGWPLVGYSLLFGILIGGVVSLVYLVFKALLRRYTLFTAIPYGPFLIAGAMVILFM